MINLTYMNGFDDIRILFVGMFSAVCSFFAPITDYIFALTIVFLLDFLAGLISSILVNNEKFKFSKFRRCLIDIMVYFIIITSIYAVGEFTHKLDGAIQCASGVMFVIIYYYAVNIFRNLSILMPNNNSINFIYYVLSFEILSKYPILKRFNGIKDKKEDK